MSPEVTATLVYEHDTDWAFLSLGGDGDWPMVLDRAETALYARDDVDALIDAAEDHGDGTSHLELGTVSITEDGCFDGLTVTADVN